MGLAPDAPSCVVAYAETPGGWRAGAHPPPELEVPRAVVERGTPPPALEVSRAVVERGTPTPELEVPRVVVDRGPSLSELEVPWAVVGWEMVVSARPLRQLQARRRADLPVVMHLLVVAGRAVPRPRTLFYKVSLLDSDVYVCNQPRSPRNHPVICLHSPEKGKEICIIYVKDHSKQTMVTLFVTHILQATC